MKRGFADTTHGQIHYVTEGSGEPILCLHQGPNSSVDFVRVLPILGKKYRAMAMDTLGFGDSDKPNRQYEISDYARSVVDFLDTLGIDKINLVGWHTGAGIAGEVAAGYPDRVDKLILSGYPLYAQEMLDERKIKPPPHISVIEPLYLKKDGSHLIAPWEGARELVGGKASLEEIHELVLGILKGGPRNIEGHLALWRYGDRGGAEKRLTLIKNPCLVLTTPKDLFYFQTEIIRKLIPRSKVTIIGKDAPSFYVPFVAAEQYAEAIMAFLENPGI